MYNEDKTVWLTAACLTPASRSFLPSVAIALSLLLVACGGGGSDAPAAADNTPRPAENNNDPASGGNSSAAAPRHYDQPDNNHIRPGVNVSSVNGSCTSNFLYYTDANNYYLGAAAHCFSPDTNDGSTPPCRTSNARIGSAVTIQNAQFPGTLAYTSWDAMQLNAEPLNSAACTYNDFALVRIDERDLNNIHPAAFVFGGPTGFETTTVANGTSVVSYGRSSLNVGVQSLQEKEGQVIGIQGGGWNYRIRTDNPGVSGDSGSAVLRGDNGKALGVLVTVGVSIGLGAPVENGVVSLKMALDYAQGFFGNNLKLETWSTFSR